MGVKVSAKNNQANDLSESLQFVPNRDLTNNDQLKQQSFWDDLYSDDWTNLGNGTFLKFSEWNKNYPAQIILFEKSDGTKEFFRVPSYFDVCCGLGAKDVDGDGDRDIILRGRSIHGDDPAVHGILVYINIGEIRSGESADIDVSLVTLLKEFLEGRSKELYSDDLDIIRISIALNGPEKFAKMLLDELVAEGRFDFDKVDRLYSLLSALNGTYNNLELVRTLHPFFSEALTGRGMLGQRIFMSALSGLPIESSAEMIRLFSPKALADAFVSQSYGGEERWFNNALLGLNEKDQVAASSISAFFRSARTKEYNRFPAPGVDEFKKWYAFVGSSMATYYVNYIVEHIPERARDLLDGLSNGGELKIVHEMAENGLSLKAMDLVGVHEKMDNELLGGLMTRKVLKLDNLHISYVENFLKEYELTAIETAYLLASCMGCGEKVHAFFSEKNNPKYIGKVVEELYAISPTMASKLVSRLTMNNYGFNVGPYVYNDDTIMSESSRFNPTIVYRAIKNLPVNILSDLLGMDDTGSYDMIEFQTKSAFLAQLEFDKPDDFKTIIRKIRGPFIGNGMRIKEAASRLKTAYESSNRSSFMNLVFNSTYLPWSYLSALIDELPSSMINHIKNMCNDESGITNYAVIKKLGLDPLSRPDLVYGYLLRNSYHFDPAVSEMILSDIAQSTDEVFLNTISKFMRSTNHTRHVDDTTGLGWIYKFLKEHGYEQRIDMLKANSKGYFEQVDFLRQRGIDIDLYRIGDFEEPLTAEEMNEVIVELKKFPPEKLDKIKGITIIDKPGEFVTLGSHDTFGNVVLFRQYKYVDLKRGIRIKETSFMMELLTHEGWHADENDLSKEEFALYSRCAGYQRTGLYSPEYGITERRTMVSTYHENVHEEFAEAGTNYELAASSFRKRALEALETGDVYLALEYLFFKHVPAETKGKEYPLGEVVPASETITIDSIRKRIESLESKGIIKAQKAGWVRSILSALESF